LIDRIQSLSPAVPLIELLTLLSLVQVRLHRGVLKLRHREEVIQLLDSSRFKSVSAYPPKVRGYLGRMREDLAVQRFNLATVLQEWNTLPTTARTGWLKRRRDAPADKAQFWADKEIESVAEHELATLGLAATFLDDVPEGGEHYKKLRVLEMLLVHDLAEARLGDQLPANADVKAEIEALWKYGAFTTYRGVGNIWWMPKLFEEFCEGTTIDARIAQDFDRLQFMLQARIYRDGMSEEGRAECEQTAEKFTTDTVRHIWQNLLPGFPAPSRFEPLPPRY
jgi:5'-deoxynucleotidase YfbR-like HD superfamily hydrolase